MQHQYIQTYVQKHIFFSIQKIKSKYLTEKNTKFPVISTPIHIFFYKLFSFLL